MSSCSYFFLYDRLSESEIGEQIRIPDEHHRNTHDPVIVRYEDPRDDDRYAERYNLAGDIEQRIPIELRSRARVFNMLAVVFHLRSLYYGRS